MNRTHIRRAIRLAVAAVLGVALLIPGQLALAQQLPPGPTTRYQSTLELPGLPGTFELVQLILDFAPGAWTPPHSHGGPGLITVLEGELTVRERGVERRYRAGERWVEGVGEVAEVGNASSTKGSILVTFALPVGQPLTTVADVGTAQLPPGPTTVYQSRTALNPQVGPFDLIQLVLDFAPGAWTPPHSHGGPGLVTVLDGQFAVRERGTQATYRPGEMWLELPRQVAEVGNATAARATLAVSFVLPKGAPLTTVQPAATALPRTGSPVGSFGPHPWLAAGAGVVFLGGWLLRRRGLERLGPGQR